MSDGLTVYLRNGRVGRLWLDEKHRFASQYEEAWLASGRPALTRPTLRAEVYADDSPGILCQPATESDLRKAIARAAKTLTCRKPSVESAPALSACCMTALN
jgi:hypothetical protein